MEARLQMRKMTKIRTKKHKMIHQYYVFTTTRLAHVAVASSSIFAGVPSLGGEGTKDGFKAKKLTYRKMLGTVVLWGCHPFCL